MKKKHCGIDALRRDLTKRFIDQLLVYQVVQAHTTQAGWEPPNLPALWQLVS